MIVDNDMASTVLNLRKFRNPEILGLNNVEEENMSKKDENMPVASTNDFDDFDFVDHYGNDSTATGDELLPGNTAHSAINCGFIGVGGGGGKLAKAFLDLGFSKTILVNTTVKDQPDGVAAEHFLLLPGADGVGKDVTLGKQILDENSALIEDVLRNRLGQIDWLFV